MQTDRTQNKETFPPTPMFQCWATTKQYRNKNKLLQGEYTWQWSRGNNAFCGKQNHRHASASIPQENKALIRTVGSSYMVGSQCRGTSMIHIYFFVISRWSKLSLKVLIPSVGKWFNFYLKNRQKLRFSHKTFTWEKTVSLTCWAGLMSIGALFSSLYYECGLQGNQNWLYFFCPSMGKWFNFYLKAAKITLFT